MFGRRWIVMEGIVYVIAAILGYSGWINRYEFIMSIY